MTQFSFPQENRENHETIIEVLFEDKQDFVTQDFTLEVELDDANGTAFSIPFTVPKKVKKGKVYALNEEIEIDNQKMTIKNVTVYPLRVAVDIDFDESNSMKIMEFEDLRIEDEDGEVWSSVENGIRGHGASETGTNHLFTEYLLCTTKKLSFENE